MYIENQFENNAFQMISKILSGVWCLSLQEYTYHIRYVAIGCNLEVLSNAITIVLN